MLRRDSFGSDAEEGLLDAGDDCSAYCSDDDYMSEDVEIFGGLCAGGEKDPAEHGLLTATEKMNAIINGNSDKTTPTLGDIATVSPVKDVPSFPTGQYVTSKAMTNLSTDVNTEGVNERKFHTTEVSMRLIGTLQQLSNGAKIMERMENGLPIDDIADDAVLPVLELDAPFAGFEGPNFKQGDAKSAVHAQGRIFLVDMRTTFPTSIGLKPCDTLRGALAGSAYSSTGMRFSHITFPRDNKSYMNTPVLVAHSNMGLMTHRYARDYPDFLRPGSLNKCIKKVKNDDTLVMVKIDSPLFDSINAMREAAMAKAKEIAKEKGEKFIEESNMKPLETGEKHNEVTKHTYAPMKEAASAMEMVNETFNSEVNYVPLYESFKFQLIPAFAKEDANGELSLSDAWLQTDELLADKKGRTIISDSDKAVHDAALNTVHSVHAKFVVEYQPLASLAKAKSGGSKDESTK